MPILVICQDSDNAGQLRKTHLPAHLDYIEQVAPLICVAGPMRQALKAREAGQYDGSCFIYDTNDIDLAHKLLNDDPYSANGVFESVAFSEFVPAAGNWIGGLSWK